MTLRSPGEGQLGELFRQKDWGTTLLGPFDGWPTTLKGYVRMVLKLPTPAIIFWGPEQVQLYNDGYAVIMGPRHPRYLGARYRDCWPDTYDTIHPWMERVLQGDVVEVDRTLIPLTRRGYNEEAFFTFTLSPLHEDANRISGILQIVTEMTDVVLAERRERTVRALSPPTDIHIEASSTDRIVSALRDAAHDIPRALLFLRSPDNDAFSPAAFIGSTPEAEPAQLSSAELEEARGVVEQVLARGEPVERDDWERFSRSRPSGAWPEPVTRILALPLRRTEPEQPAGVILLGVSPRLEFDARYRDFFHRMAREIAHHLAVHQELALAEQLKLALDSAKLGTWVVDVQKNRVRLSERTASFVGAETVTEHDFDRINRELIHPDDLDRVQQTLGSALQEHTLYSCEYRIVRKDGQVRWLHSWGRAAYDNEGRATTLSGLTLDITDTRRLVEELSAAVRARDEFLSIASHELKTPLTSLLLHLQGRRRALQQEATSTPELSRLIQQTEKQALRLSRLVNDMMDVSRIATGRLELAPEPTELCALATDTVERLQPQFDAAAVPLTLHPCEPLVIHGDRDRLEQVIENLLTNALRYGGRTPVEVKVCEVRGHAQLLVRDRGPGLSAENRERVFERFERAVPANEVSGLGLGLFISREIVLRHHGRIWVESEPGGGSTFYVELPLARRPG